MASYECINLETNREITSSTSLCPGKYYLRDAGAGAIRISAPNITLDCKGAEISGDGNGIGIKVNAAGGRIENCAIKNYETGVSTAADRLTVKNISTFTTNFGVYIYNSSNAKVDGGKINGSNYGVHATSAPHLIIKNVETSENEKAGIYLYDVVGGVLSANTITNSEIGIHVLKNSKGATFANNEISSCNDAIFISDLGEHTVCSSTLENNQRGIVAKGSVGRLKIINNTLRKNSVHAVSLFDTNYNELTFNTITSNGDGIVLSGSSGNTLYANKITNNNKGVTISETSKDNKYNHNEFIGNKMHIPISPLRNEFFTTTDRGIKQGNYWDEITNVNITDINKDGYGDSKFKSSPMVAKIGVGVNDEGPIIDREVISKLNITLPADCKPVAQTVIVTEEKQAEPETPNLTENEGGFVGWLKSLFQTAESSEQ